MEDSKILTAVIAAISAIISGIVGAAAGAYTQRAVARLKIAELQETYDQKLQDGYLEKAREFTKQIYLPLSISLANLGYSYQLYRTSYTTAQKWELEKNELLKTIGNTLKVHEEFTAEVHFKRAIDDFLKVVQELAEKGANAFLTTELDDRLQSFCSFCSESRLAKKSTIKVIFKFNFPFFSSVNQELTISRKARRFSKLPFGLGEFRADNDRFSFNYGGFGGLMQVKEILSAPISSDKFEERFVRDIYHLNVLVKEVTLGAKAKD